jgi:hypothetical protein
MESKLPGQQVVKLRVQTVLERLFGLLASPREPSIHDFGPDLRGVP